MSKLKRKRHLALHHGIPSLRPTLSDALILILAAVAVGFAAQARLGADYVSIQPPFAKVSPLSNPLAPGEHAIVTRPLASFIISSLPGAYEDVPADLQPRADDPEKAQRIKAREAQQFLEANRQRFAKSLHVATFAALAVAMLGTFAWLKYLLRRGRYATLPACAALLMAVSPWLGGQSGSPLAFSELLALAFATWALALYSVNPYGEPTVLWSLAPPIWLLGLCAMASSESALLLPLYCVMVDLVAFERGSRLKKIVERRLLTSYLPLCLLAAAFLFFSSILENPALLLETATGRLSACLALFGKAITDPYEFAALGRWPETLFASLVWPVGLGVPLALAFALLFTRLRLGSMWLACFAASFAALVLPGRGGELLSSGLLVWPAFFATLFAATAMIGLGGQKMRVPGVKWRLPAVAMMLLAAGASGWAQRQRLIATADRGEVLAAAANARPTLPEVALFASENLLAEAVRSGDPEVYKAKVKESNEFWEKSLNFYIETLAKYPGARPHMPREQFTLWVEKLLREDRLIDALDFLRRVAKAEPDEPVHRLQLSFLLAASGDLDEAAKTMRGALREAQSTDSASKLARSPEQRFMLAFLLFRVGEAKQGEALLREVVATVDDALALAEAMAERVARATGDEAAARFLTAFIENGDLSPEALARMRFERGRYLARVEGREADAKADFEAVLDHPSLGGKARALLSRLSLSMLDFERVKQLCRQPGEPPVVPTFEEFMAMNVGQALQAGDAAKADAWLQGWAERSAPGVPRAKVLLASGQLAEKAGRQADALKSFRAAAAEAPGQPVVARALADFLLRNDLFEEAEAVLRDGFSLAGDDMAMLSAYCDLMIRLDKAEEAAHVVEAYIDSKQGADRPEPHFWLGRIYSALELRQPAVEQLDKALALAPGHALTKLALAEELARTPDFERGAEILAKMIAENPAEGDFYVRLAKLYRENGDLDSASEAVRLGVHNLQASGKASAPLYVEGGRLALSAGDIDTAEQSFRQAERLLPQEDAEARSEIAGLLGKVADAKKRRADLERLKGQAAEKPEEPQG